MWEGQKIQTKLTDSEIILRCQSSSGCPPPWDVFFQRFIPFLDKRIIKALLEMRIPIDRDLVYTIRGRLEERLFRDRILDKLDNVSKFKPWMRRVVRNHTIDWARKTSRYREAAERLDKANTASLSDPVSPNDKRLIEEVIAEEKVDNKKLRAQVASALERLEDLGDRYKWIIKASIMFYDPLSADDIEALSRQRRLPAAQIRKEAEALMRDMQRRYEKVVNDKEIAFNLHAEIHFAEARLKELRKNPQADPEQENELREQIRSMDERRKRLLANNLRPIRPTSRQLADFLGVSQDNATAINTLIHRARKILIAQSTEQGCHK